MKLKANFFFYLILKSKITFMTLKKNNAFIKQPLIMPMRVIIQKLLIF